MRGVVYSVRSEDFWNTRVISEPGIVEYEGQLAAVLQPFTSINWEVFYGVAKDRYGEVTTYRQSIIVEVNSSVLEGYEGVADTVLAGIQLAIDYGGTDSGAACIYNGTYAHVRIEAYNLTDFAYALSISDEQVR